MVTDNQARDDGVLLTEVRGATLLVTLNRPDRGNALSGELMIALTALWTSTAADPELRCVVITGAGRAFCTGADVELLASDRRDVGDTAAAELAFLPGSHLDIPVIVAVNGTCAGGGLHFLADADISIAADTATFLDPHVTVGQVSALEPLGLRLKMRPDRLARMVLLGRSERLDAATAEQAGLVSQVTAPDALLDTALELAERIAANSPEAVRLSRRVLRTFEERLLGTDADLGWELIRRHWAHPDAAEGPAAFLEKRAPSWAPKGTPPRGTAR